MYFCVPLLFIASISSAHGQAHGNDDNTEPTKINVEVGHRLELECKIPTGKGLHAIRWYETFYSRDFIGQVNSLGHTSMDSKWSKRATIQGDTIGSSTLILEKAIFPTDTGLYKCIGMIGSVEYALHSFKVTVLDWHVATSATDKQYPNPNTSPTPRFTSITDDNKVTLSTVEDHAFGSKLGTTALVGIACGVAAVVIVVIVMAVIILDRMGKTPQCCRKQGKAHTRCIRNDPPNRDEARNSNVYNDMHNVYYNTDKQNGDEYNTIPMLNDQEDTHYCDISDVKIEKQPIEHLDALYTNDYTNYNESHQTDADPSATSSLLGKDTNEAVYSVARKTIVRKEPTFALDENDRECSSGLTATPETQPIECYDQLTFDDKDTTSPPKTADSGAIYSNHGGHDGESNEYSLTYPLANRAGKSGGSGPSDNCAPPSETYSSCL